MRGARRKNVFLHHTHLEVGAREVHEYLHPEVLLGVRADGQRQVARAAPRAPRHVHEQRLQRRHALHPGGPAVRKKNRRRAKP